MKVLNLYFWKLFYFPYIVDIKSSMGFFTNRLPTYMKWNVNYGKTLKFGFSKSHGFPWQNIIACFHTEIDRKYEMMWSNYESLDLTTKSNPLPCSIQHTLEQLSLGMKLRRFSVQRYRTSNIKVKCMKIRYGKINDLIPSGVALFVIWSSMCYTWTFVLSKELKEFQ